MKKCRRCSKPATFHITEIQNSVAKPVHLCETCAREYLEADSDEAESNPAAELAAKIDALVAEDDDTVSTRCGECDMAFSEFREKGRLGCPSCYMEFRGDLMPLLENIHEEAVHGGKTPKYHVSSQTDQSRLMHLRVRQQDAINKEDYETAALLRDEISELEASLRTDDGLSDDHAT